MDTYDPNMEDYYGDYVDFDIPWSLRVDYSFSYQQATDEGKIGSDRQGIGDFSLSPNWKIGFNTGYDLDTKAIYHHQFKYLQGSSLLGNEDFSGSLWNLQIL